ncbi:MAG: LCP family protein [Anaerolineae bacterium]|nr:LCP family protein [Thermoflexales bacterium]MDW8395190.1 LCP family protein [Anaerolineae bacterium]
MSRRKRLGLAFISGLAAFALLTLGASVLAYRWAYDYFANQLTILPEIMAAPRPVIVATPLPEEQIVLPQPWDGKERVNVLLLGIDQRAGDQEPAYRTDTMIVFTLDPVAMEGGMLSIPRDVWVPIPGFENNRINAANFIGDTRDYPGGGIALAKKTVEHFLGVPIHYVVRINFTVFETFIDRIGGITIEVPEDIYDPNYPTEDYRTELFQLSKGVHTLNGETALKYARTRHSAGGDFDRARRQQQVILAVRERLKNPQVLASLIAAAPELLLQLNTSIKTNMTLEEMERLAVLAREIDPERIKSEVIDQRYTEFATTPEGYQVVIPNRARIAELRERFFNARQASATRP